MIETGPAAAQSLREKADTLEEIVEMQFYAPDGLMFSFLDVKTRQPFTEADLSGYPVRFKGGPPPHDYLSHENTPMVMGSYLSALVWKERAGRTPLGSERIAKVFAGIRSLAEISAREFEEGWLCKPFGGRGSLESSNDQYGEVIAGLRELALFKEHPDSASAAELLVTLTDFWMRHDYRCPFHGNRHHRWMGRSQWGLVTMGFVRAAWEITGERAYLEETLRLCAAERCDRPESRKGNFIDCPYPDRPETGIRDLSAYHHLVVRFLDLLYEAWPERRDDWEALLSSFWENDAAPGLDRDGLLYANYEVDKVTNRWRPLASGFLPLPAGAAADHPRRWVGPFKTGAISCFAAASAVLTGSRIPARLAECRGFATRILERLEDHSMTFILDPDGSLERPDLPPIRSRMLDGRAPAQWLLAYWRGRTEGWWEAGGNRENTL